MKRRISSQVVYDCDSRLNYKNITILVKEKKYINMGKLKKIMMKA